MELDKEQLPQRPIDALSEGVDDFSVDDIKFEAPERPQIQLSKRSAALRCGDVAIVSA